MSILGKCTAFSLVSCAPGSSPRVWRHWCPKPMQKGFSSCRRLSRGDMLRKMLSMLSMLSMDHLNVGYPNLDPYTCAVRDFDFGSSSSNCIWLVVASKNFIFHPNKGNEHHKWLKKRSCDGANICNPYTYIQWYPIISDFGTCTIYIHTTAYLYVHIYMPQQASRWCGLRQAMMQWDPNRRGSAAKILHHPYFEAPTGWWGERSINWPVTRNWWGTSKDFGMGYFQARKLAASHF